MTVLAAILGLLPAAFSTRIGSQSQRPLAIVVVGGVLVTLLLTQYLMPVLYTFFPGKAGDAPRNTELSEGSHYTDEILQEDPGPNLDPPTEDEGEAPYDDGRDRLG